MHTSLEIPYELNDIVNVIIEVEGACGPWHAACVPPLGDVDLVMGKHVLHGAAQQRREVAGHGRHDQELGVLAASRKGEVSLEIDEIAEWLSNDSAPPYLDLQAIHIGGWDVPGRLPIPPRGPLEQLERRGSATAEHGVRGRVQRIAEQEPVSFRRRPRRAQRSLIELVQMVKHGSTSRSSWGAAIHAASQTEMVILCCAATKKGPQRGDGARLERFCQLFSHLVGAKTIGKVRHIAAFGVHEIDQSRVIDTVIAR